MSEAHDELDQLSREDLIARARVLGVERAHLMTRVELRDEIIRRSEPDVVRRQRSRGWLGVARDLVASVVEAGLNMRDAAALIRGEAQRGGDNLQGPAPVATVTLAEIYAAQGHYERALNMLEEVLQREPEHEVARALRERLRGERERGAVQGARKRRPPEPVALDEEAAAWEPSAPTPSAEAEAREPEPPEISETDSHVHEPPAPETKAIAETAPPEEPALVVLRDGELVYLYWEVPAGWFSPSENGAERPLLVARAIGFSPRELGPERSELDFEPTERVGGAFVPGLAPSTVVRAALGHREGARFHALAVASELFVRPGGTDRRFWPLGSEPSQFEAVEARAAAHFKSRRP